MTKIQTIEENALTYYKGIARLLGGQTFEQDQITWFTTGRRSLLRFNGVLRTVAPRAEDLRRVADPVLNVFRSQNLPFFWVDWPGVSTPGLGEYLRAKGLSWLVFSIPPMTRKLDDLPPLTALESVEITEVQTLQDQADWLDVLMEGFAEPEPARPDFQQYLAHSLSEPNPVFQHFLARWEGKPCAISTLLRAQASAGIYHVTTLPAYRGHGLGKALTLKTMYAAQADYSLVVLFATPDGYPLYQQLGFKPGAKADLYGWDGTG